MTSVPAADRLRAIKRLDQLIAYLRDELDWPIASDDVEDISFSYGPEELGLDAAHAAKIHQIKQIRPLVSGQPWGVFWVSFEKKRLPVVVLRRILASLVVKSRQSANSADRPRWRLNDLLFVSAYGDEATDQREIAFAHFSQVEGDLPTLRVLGRDAADTALTLNHVAQTLADKLHWPARPNDVEAWRAQWSSAFRHKLGHKVKTADVLAETLAALARDIRDNATKLLAAESERGPLTKLYKAFRAALIHDLTPETFADTYAQTITYGLFTAAVNRTDLSGGTEATFVKADDMALMARSTSPFLKEMLETFLTVGGRKHGVDFDELGIQDVVELLRGDKTDLPAILRDFGNRTRGEDPVIHFYEHFLSAYNKKLKVQRGVFYTPQPVVSYIVRSVHELLRTEFGLADGLASTLTWGEMMHRFGGTSSTSPPSNAEPAHPASPSRPARRSGAGEEGRLPAEALAQAGGEVGRSAIDQGQAQGSAIPKSEILTPKFSLPPLSGEPGDTRTVSPDEPFVQILDPAAGTATFLVEVIDIIFKHLKPKWAKGGLAAMPKVTVAGAGEERQRTAALQDASRNSGAPGHRASVLDCACPLALSFADYWNFYVPQHLLPRLHGYELLAAPYAIAHLKLGLKLTETGYRFGNPERARIYLTNALEPPVRQMPLIGFEPLAHEALAVNEIKRHKRFTVVIGNPPYANFGQLNRIPFILNLLEDYKRGLDEKKINLDDDFIKFIRLSEAHLSAAGVGIHGMITNNAYLDGLTHRQMRRHLLEAFPAVRVLNLHGSSKKKEMVPDGTPDENVFDITVGVAIGIFCRAPKVKNLTLAYSDVWGSRQQKTQQLGGDGTPIRWGSLTPTPDSYFFVPKDFSREEDYQAGWNIRDAFSVWQNGLKTDRDELFFDFEKDALSQRMRRFYAPKLDPQFREQYQIVASSSYDIEARRLATKFADANIRRCLYRPMDIRWLYYEPNLTSRPAEKVMRHMLGGPNLGLIATRQTQEKWDVLPTTHLSGHKSCAAYDINSLFPLYLYEEALAFNPGQKDGESARGHSKRPNFAASFLRALASALKLPQKGAHGLPSGVTPEDIFHYAYAVFHSPGYRRRYAEFLKIDFPQLPLTGNLELFRALARLGGELVALHLLEFAVGDSLSPPRGEGSESGEARENNQNREPNDPSPSIPLPSEGRGKPGYPTLTEHLGSRAPEVEKVTFVVGRVPSRGEPEPTAPAGGSGPTTGTVFIDKAQTTGFVGVPEEVWHFHIGGYQVCEKWLKDRKGRVLSADDLAHYQKIVVALSETIRLMAEIDRVIEAHGGWPLK